MADINSSITLLNVYQGVQRSITPFWLNAFPQTVNFDTEEIYWDKISTDRRYLAPLVVPSVQGRVMSIGGFSSVSFKPAYVKPKHALTPNMLIPRQAGDNLLVNTPSLATKRNAMIAHILSIHKSLHANRQEWLAARAIIDGGVTLASEDYPSTYVDFRRDAALTIVLTGTSRWSEAGTAAPLANLRSAKLVSNNLAGARITRHVFGADAWDLFTQRVNLRDLMDNTKGGYDVNVSLMNDGYEGQEYMGTISGANGGGRIECWVDTSKYKDETGTEQFFLDQKTVVGLGPADGVRCFGAIKDFDSLIPQEVFIKQWKHPDPSEEYILSQSAPLMVPRNPNATFSIKVAT